MVGLARNENDFTIDISTPTTDELDSEIGTGTGTGTGIVDMLNANNDQIQSINKTVTNVTKPPTKHSERVRKQPVMYDMVNTPTITPSKQSKRKSSKSKVIPTTISSKIESSDKKTDGKEYAIEKFCKRFDAIMVERVESKQLQITKNIPNIQSIGIKDLEYEVQAVKRLVQDSIESRKDIDHKIKVMDLENQLQCSRAKNETLNENSNNQHVLEIVKTFCNTQCHVATVTSHFNPYHHGQNLGYLSSNASYFQVLSKYNIYYPYQYLILLCYV